MDFVLILYIRVIALIIIIVLCLCTSLGDISVHEETLGEDKEREKHLRLSRRDCSCVM